MPLAPLYPASGLWPGPELYPSNGEGWLYPSGSLYPGSVYPGRQPEDAPLAWPDAELAICDLLEPVARTGTETRPSLEWTLLPYIRVTRTGGSDDGITDTASISVDVFARDRTQAKATAEQARQVLIGSTTTPPARATAHGVIDRVTTITGPAPLPPTDSGNLRMVVASYRVSMRRQAS